MTLTPARTRHIGVGTFVTTQRMRDLVSRVLDSGRISYGPMSLEFEQRFSRLHGCQYGILSSSGTSALQIGLQALKETRNWNNGDRVICPATTFIASANVILHNGMVPTFVDVDPVTFNLNPDLIERALTGNTRAIMAVHLFGQPANMTVINDIARRYGLAVIEDSCECIGAMHRGHVVGSLSDVAGFSFYAAHIVVTGVGGMATTNDSILAGKIRSLSNHGLTLDCLDPGINFSPRPVPNRSFRFESVGHSSRLTEIEAAIGLAQLDDLTHELAARRRNALHLFTGLSNINKHYREVFQLPVIAEGNTHSYMMFNVVLKEGDRESLIRHLASYGVETRDSLPLLIQPAFRYVNQDDYPVSVNLIRNAFYVGVHGGLTVDDMSYLVDCFGTWVDPDYGAMYLK